MDGTTMLRECVSGKHAYFQTIGTWQVEEAEGPFSGTVPTPTLTIVEEETTHLAGVPFKLKAQTLLSAKNWEWKVNGQPMTVNAQTSILNLQHLVQF